MDPLQLTSVVLVTLVATLSYSSWASSGRHHVGAQHWGAGFLVFGAAMGLALARHVVEDHRVLSALSGLLIVLGGWFHYRGFAVVLNVSSPRRLRRLLAALLVLLSLSGVCLVAWETTDLARIAENGFNTVHLVLIVAALGTTRVRLPRGQKVLLALLLGALAALYGGSTLGSVANLVHLEVLAGWDDPFEVQGPIEWIVALSILATCENLLLVALVSREHGASLEHSARTSARLLGANQELGRFQEAIVGVIGRVLDVRAVGEGAGHHRVAQLTEAILMTLGYSSQYSRQVGLASILGTIERVPGGDLGASDLPFYQLARLIADERLEHWDGSGLPLGKSRDEISLEARVVSVASHYLALSQAVGAPTQDEVNRTLLQSAGTRFDPEVVRACLACAPNRGT